jgi:hypothetical protein
VRRVGYALVGPVQRLFEHVDDEPGQYTEADLSPYFWHKCQTRTQRGNGRWPPAASPTTGSASVGSSITPSS